MTRGTTRTAMFAALTLGALASASPALAAPSSTAKVTVLTSSAQQLSSGGLKVRVTAKRASKVNLSGSASGGTGGARRAFARKTLTFKGAGSKVVTLSPRGASAAATGCPSTRVIVNARSRVAQAPRRSQTRRRRQPAFTGSVRASSVRAAALPKLSSTRRSLSGDDSKCYRVGVAKRSINPEADGSFAGKKTVHLGGYGLGSNAITGMRTATGILGDDGATVRAFAVNDGKKGNFAIADMELQGWFTANKDAPLGIVDMRKEIQKRTGGALKASEVIIQSNHSHGGADAIGVWGGVPIEFRRFIFEQTVQAIIEAFDTAQPGQLFYGAVDGVDLLSNQFGYDEANKVLDSDVRVLQARDPAGKTFATLLNFSAHTTVLGSSNRKVSGDWTQAATPMMEKKFGGEAVTIVRTLGRTQPARADCANKELKDAAADLCKIDDYASRVVARAEKALAVAEAVPGDPIVAATSYLIQDVGNNGVILGLNYAGDPAGAPVNRSLSPPWLTGDILGTVTSSARIGDILMSSFPGEAYPQIPLLVKKTVPARGYMTAGLAQDQLGYLIAPYESYPEPIRRTFFNQRGDEVNPISNDNYAFNISMTIGERVQCSALRGAGEVFGKGLQFRETQGVRCGIFLNDLQMPAGADTK